ncbi:hypothetical protein Tco_0620526 [Tanacetum coccineum]
MLEVWQNWPLKRDYRSGNKKNNASASGLGKGSKDQSQDQCQNLVHVCNRFIKYYVSLISEAFYVQCDINLWKDGSVLYMGDDHFTPVHGKGSVVLEFSSGKSITLFNVLYVPKLRKNLISGPVLNKTQGFLARDSNLGSPSHHLHTTIGVETQDSRGRSMWKYPIN